ncbi:MAG: molybdenum cofactor synthesis protein [Chlorobi bacterium]|nr:molybdenum cofactor synthesis protein [Chlorobiota bacterium]
MEQFIDIISVNISAEKGTVKKPVPEITITGTGIAGDVHAGHWHRQVSLLASESIQAAAEKAAADFPPGIFAENITTRGFPVHKARILDRFAGKNIELEVTQIGKECHTQCEISRKTGNCIMPIEGIFCRVITGGKMVPGDKMIYKPFVFRSKVITLSDRAAKGIYSDRSGPEVKRILEGFFKNQERHFAIDNTIIPDNPSELEHILDESISDGYHAIFTTGSTGVGPQDIAPDVLKPLFDKEIPGIMDHIRLKYGQTNPNALISRSVAGTIDKTMIFALPGSVKAVKEYMTEITPLLEHLLRMIHSIDNH